MYQQFFGFNSLPFKITPDERVFFAGAHRQEMLDALLYGIERGEGIITVIGEVGIGKTTLARVLSNRFSQCFSIISIFTPNVSALDMLRLIAQEAGLHPSAEAGKVELMQAIRSYCLHLHQQGKRFLLLIDEAQTMFAETIEELRLLSNMQVDDVKLVQVLLFGQPELDRMLNSPELRQVKDRVVFQIHIQPFSRDELAEYLSFRLQQAGYQGQYFFSDEVVDAIFRKSQGYARAVNRLADQALMAAFAEQTHQLTVDHVESSNQEATTPLAPEVPASTQSVQGWQRIKTVKFMSFGLMGLIVLLLLLVMVFYTTVDVQKDSANAVQPSPAKTNSAAQTPPQNLPTQQPQPSVEMVEKERVDANLMPVVDSVAPEGKSDSSSTPSLTDTDTDRKWMASGRSDAQWREIHQQQLVWFNQLASEDKVTIQLMSSPWRLRESFVVESSRIIERLPKAPAFYYDYSAAVDRPRIAVIYGVYDSKELAKQALRILNEGNKGYRPEMVSFKQVVESMKKSLVLVEQP